MVLFQQHVMAQKPIGYQSIQYHNRLNFRKKNKGTISQPKNLIWGLEGQPSLGKQVCESDNYVGKALR